MVETIRLKIQALLDYLDGAEILISRTDGGSMSDRAVARFTFDLGLPATILCGHFQERIKELVAIAHEAGHVLIYRKMNREEKRNYVCTMFAVNKMGVNRIAPSAQEHILTLEAEASAKGLDILKSIGLKDGELDDARALMSRWYSSYENQCLDDVVIKVREQMSKEGNPALI